MGRLESKRDRVRGQRDTNSLTFKYDIAVDRCGTELLPSAFESAEAQGFSVDEFISASFDCRACVNAMSCALSGRGNLY